MSHNRVLIAGLAVAAAVSALGGAAVFAPNAPTYSAQQPWDPGCWGPFSWDSGDCDWSPGMGGSSGNGPWDPSVTGPGQFNRGDMGPGMMGPGMMGSP